MRRFLFACGLASSCTLLLHCSSDSMTNSASSGTDAGRDGSQGEGSEFDAAGVARGGGGGKQGTGGATGNGGAAGGGGRADAESGGGPALDAGSDSSAFPDGSGVGAGGVGTGGSGSGGVGTGGMGIGSGGVGSGGTGTGGTGSGGTGAGGKGTGGSGAGGTPNDPNAGRVRFMNVAPGAPALDVCMKLTSDVSYTAQPIFKALGRTTGLAFGEMTEYEDLGTDPAKYYDFLFVGASTGTCAPPFYGQIGTRLISATGSATLAIYQYSFGVNAYNGALVSDLGSPTTAKANVRFQTATQTPVTADFYGTPTAGAETSWFSAVPYQSGTAFHATDAGTYSFRVTAGGSATTIAQTSGVALTLGKPIDVILYPSDATHYGLMRCPSTPASPVVSCMP